MKTLTLSFLFTLPLLAASCGGGADDGAQTGTATSTSTLPDSYVLASVPADAQDVSAARADLADGDTVTMRGFIGGSKKPFVEGLAAFTLVDPALEPCAPDEGCKTPWDYCCTDPRTMADNSVTVEFRDGDMTRAGSVLGEHGLDHLAEVVVQGVAERDEQGNVTIVASGVLAMD